MATADYWSDADLKALTYGGLINEDVMQKIWNISQIPLPFTDAVGIGMPIKATPYSWTTDSQASVDLTNALVDGADATGNQAAGGARVQNHAQISDKVVTVTERASAVDTIGRANELAYQLGMRQRDLRRDIEAIALTGQASVADNGDSTAGKVAGFSAWLTSNDYNGTSGAATGFNTSTGVVAAVTVGETRVLLTDTYLKACVESVYLNNGNPSVLMSRPELIARLNKFIIGSPTSMGIATPTANVSGQGAGVEQTAQGYVNVIVTDFGFTLKLVPNRLQQAYTSADTPTADSSCDVFLIDTGMVELAYLIPEHTETLGKAGTADKRQISAQWGMRVMDEKAHGVIRDIDPTGTVAASA